MPLNTVITFLNELRSSSVTNALDSLNILLNELEKKNDPEPIEMEIVSRSYQLFEAITLVEAALRKYKISNHILIGNKIDSLREKED